MTETKQGGSRENGPDDSQLERVTPAAAGGKEIRIGVFVILGLFGALLLLFLLTDPATFRGRYIVTTVVDDAGGVRSGDPVQMRGVNIGRVRQFSMENDQVTIHLEINGEWEIPVDSRTRVAGMGLLGGRTIEVVPGTSSEILARGDRIPGESTGDLTDLAGTLGEDAAEIMDRIRGLIDDPTVDALQGTAMDARVLVGELSSMVARQQDEVDRLASSLRRSAEGLEESLEGPELARTLARADSTMAELHRSSQRLDRASASLEEVLRRMEEGEGTLGRLSADDSVYENLNLTLESFRALAEDIQENPGRYVRLRIF
ncbi:MAG: MCE family protein [Gemmatimonadales bacterium]|nr:MAG: MCE family protein [Gemmatimonadales bacterium]